MPFLLQSYLSLMLEAWPPEKKMYILGSFLCAFVFHCCCQLLCMRPLLELGLLGNSLLLCMRLCIIHN